MIYTPRFIQISSVYLGFNTNSCENKKQVFVVAFYPTALLKYIMIKYFKFKKKHSSFH